MRLGSLVYSLASVSNIVNDSAPIRDAVESCTTDDGISLKANVETTGVTQILQEACEAVEVLSTHYVPGTTVSGSANLQDLKEYFRRPVVVGRGSFGAGGTIARVFSLDINSLSLFSTIFPDGLTRLRGVYGVRFKMVFRLQVACTSFHQGLLCLNFQPCCNTSNDSAVYMRSVYSATSTNIPHVRLDLSSMTMAVLEVPFIHQRDFFPVNGPMTLGTTDVIGTLALNTLLPVRGGTGASETYYTLMMHLEDLELVGAAPISTSVVTLQSGMKPIAEEFENDAYPFSSALHSASRTVKWVAKGVPSLSSLAGPPAWFLGKAAGIVRYLGYSKPQIQEPVMRMNHVANVGECNVDLPSATIVAGPFASNCLAVTPKFAFNDVDETSLAYVLSQWSQIRVGMMRASDAVGTNLYICPVGPEFMWYRSTLAGGAPYCNIARRPGNNAGDTFNSFVPSHLMFFASMFQLWRGGFEFRFTFAKTKVHGGRVIVTYTPDSISSGTLPASQVAVPTVLASGPSPFSHSAIFDLRDNSTFTFKVPFTSQTPYKGLREIIGSLCMSVFDPLTYTETIASDIDFLVEVRALPDFQLAVATAPSMPVHSRPTILQSGMPVQPSVDPSPLCIGENFSSVKQLIMIPKVSSFSQAPSSSSSIAIMPWYYQPRRDNAIPGGATYPREAFSFGGNIASCYLFARGGTDCHAYVPDNQLVTVSAAQGVLYANGLITGAPSAYNYTGVSVPRVFSNNGNLHVRFPGYSKVARMFSHEYNAVTWNIAAAPNPTFVARSDVLGTLPKLFISNGAGATRQIFVSRAAADDAMLGFYMGPPPLAFMLNNTVGAWDQDSTAQMQSGYTFCHDTDGVEVPVAPITEFRNIQPVAPNNSLRRTPSGRVLSPFVSSDRGITPSQIAGSLTTFTHTIPALTTSILDAVDASLQATKQ